VNADCRLQRLKFSFFFLFFLFTVVEGDFILSSGLFISFGFVSLRKEKEENLLTRVKYFDR